VTSAHQRLFIARAGADAPIARALADRVARATDHWRVMDDVPMQAEWFPVAAEMICESHAFAMIISEHTAQSPGCASELMHAASVRAGSLPMLRLMAGSATCPAALSNTPRVEVYLDDLDRTAAHLIALLADAQQLGSTVQLRVPEGVDL
jgi:hypothetical protein